MSARASRQLVLAALFASVGCAPSLPPATRPLTLTPAVARSEPPALAPSDTAGALPRIESFDLPAGAHVHVLTSVSGPIATLTLRFAGPRAHTCTSAGLAVAAEAWQRALRSTLPRASWHAWLHEDQLVLAMELPGSDAVELVSLLAQALKVTPGELRVQEARAQVADRADHVDFGGAALAVAVVREQHGALPRVREGAALAVSDVAARGCLDVLRAFDGAVLGAAGGIDSKRLRAAFAGWSTPSAKVAISTTSGGKPEQVPALSVVHREAETVALAGWLRGPGLAAPDHAAFMVLADLLGGGGGSRMYQSLRQRLGLSYWACAELVHTADGAALVMAASVDPTRIRTALDALDDELTALQTLTADELDATRNAVREQLIALLERPETAASQLADWAAHGVDPALRLPSLLAELDALDVEQLRAVAAKYFKASTTPLVIVGEKRIVGAQLQWTGREYELIDSIYMAPTPD